MIPHRLRGFAAIAVVVAITATVATALAGAASANLDAVILSPAQVGTGYKRTTIPGGRQVAGQVTMDFCGADFPSEAKRLERFQAVYLSKTDAFGLSNEVVRYRPGGAAQAMAEVARHMENCPLNTPVPSAVTTNGVLTFVKLERLHDARLLPGAIAVRVVVDDTSEGARQRVTSVVVYQRRGDVLSGVYGQSGPLSRLNATTLRAASASATRLKHAA